MFRLSNLYLLAFYSDSLAACHWALFVPDENSATFACVGTLFNCTYNSATRTWVYKRSPRFSIDKSALLVLVAQLADVSFLKNTANICKAIDDYCCIVDIPAQAKASNGDTPGTLWVYNAIIALDSSCVLACKNTAQLRNEITKAMLTALPNFKSKLTPTYVETTRCTAS